MSLLTETSFSVTLIGTSGVGITSFLSALPTDKPNLLEIQDQVMNQTLSFSLYKNDEEYILAKRSLIICRMVPKSICLLLVYDITNKSTFSFVTQKYLSYKNKLQQGKYFVVLLGNKCDLDKKRAVPTQEAEIFASQYGLFFLEISTATRKNIELVLKVIRIRTVHLMKKLQNKNATSGAPSLTDLSTKSSHKENTDAQVDKYKVPAKPPTSGKSLGILQKNFNLPRSLSPALPRPESQKIEEEKKSITMLKESPNRDKLKELKGDDLRKSIALLMEQEENSTGARPLPALPKHQEPTIVDKTYSSPKKVTNIAQILQENNGNNASSFDKENVLNLSRQSNAQGIKSERSIIEEKVMALSRGSSPNTNRSLPKITQGQGSASKQNKSWQDKENNPESLIQSQKQKEIPVKYTFSGTKDTAKSIRRLDSSGSKADSKILDEIQPIQNIEGMIKNQTIPQIHYHVSINSLEATPHLSQLTQPNKEHSPLMPVNMNIPKHTKQDSSFNLKISQSLEDKQNMSTYSHQVPPFPPLLDVSQDLVPDSDKREEQASLLFMNQNGEESFRFHEEPPAVVKPQKVLDFIPSLNLKQEDRNDLPYKAPDVNNNNNNHKRDLPLQTPQFKLGQNDPKNFTLKPPQQKSGSQIIGAGIAPPQSDELRLEEGGLDSLSRRKDSYRVMHSEYDNYMSPKEPEDTLRKDSLNNTGKITQETVEDNQNTHNTHSTVKSEENSRVIGNKNKVSECDEIMGTIDKNIKLLEDSLYSLDANLSLTRDGPETKIKRSHSVSFKSVKQSNLLSVEEQLQESTAKKPKKKKSLKKKREKSADTSAVAKDLNFMGAEKDTLRSSFNDGKESTRTKNLLVSPKSTRRKSTSIHLASDENENSSFALLYLQFEDSNDISELVPVYADDDAYSVAERYCDGKSIKLDWPRFKVLAKVVEEKINATSSTIEAMILQNGNLSFEEKNIQDQSRSRRDTRTPRITTGRQTSRNAADESIIGKIYIELENKKIVVLNVKEHDEPNTIALRFLSLHSIKREHYKTIVSYIQEIQETFREHDGGIGECIVRNVVLKELKAHDLSARKSTSKENIPTSKSPMRSRGLVLTSKSQSQGQPPSQNQAQGINKVLFKLNFDVGKGRIAKLMVKQGDDRSKIAQNFVLTHKLSPQAYERIYEVIERTYKNKIRQDESSMNLENVIFKAE